MQIKITLDSDKDYELLAVITEHLKKKSFVTQMRVSEATTKTDQNPVVKNIVQETPPIVKETKSLDKEVVRTLIKDIDINLVSDALKKLTGKDRANLSSLTADMYPALLTELGISYEA